MITIRLFCAGGMSTSLLVTKMRQAAADAGVEADIEAHGVGSIDRRVDEHTDVVLLGPQVGYQAKQAKDKLNECREELRQAAEKMEETAGKA